VTFHSLRHFASTQLAKLNVPADRRKNVTGHADLESELWYTHLFPEDERAHAELLSDLVEIEGSVIARPSRIRKRPTVEPDPGNRPSGQPPAPTPIEAVRKHRAVRTPVEPLRGNRGIRVQKRALSGLRRGPQPVASKRPK
jgi:hypothetical protein